MLPAQELAAVQSYAKVCKGLLLFRRNRESSERLRAVLYEGRRKSGTIVRNREKQKVFFLFQTNGDFTFGKPGRISNQIFRYGQKCSMLLMASTYCSIRNV